MVSKAKARARASAKANAMRREICDFARDHGFIIHPKGYDYYIESYNKLNYCSCDKARKHCPCPEAITEVPEKGHCLCRLFWRDLDTFKEESLL